MKNKNIFIAFVLNLAFAVFEFFGGVFTGSVAITSDAVHDLGDAVSIGLACLFEAKSKKQPDEVYTYGYTRYSVIGGVITTMILLVGSVVVIFNAVLRIFNPTPINYNGMIIFAIIGVIVNFAAAYFTKDGENINQKAVNLHMLEDVLGWVVVLIGALVMRFTDFALIDSILSICVAVFIFISAFKNLKEALDLFLEKVPLGISVESIKEELCKIEGVKNVHHVHAWSVDGNSNYATMHIVTDMDQHEIKEKAREKLEHIGIVHATLELETESEHCHEQECRIEEAHGHHHHHHHHHH